VRDLGDGTALRRCALAVFDHGGRRVSACSAATTNPGGAFVIASKWLIHTTALFGLVGEQHRRAIDVQHACGRTHHLPFRDLAAEISGATSCAP
jgi:hypothetical protein